MKYKPLKAKHIKTGNIYDILNVGIDCTNERDGLEVVVYTNGTKIFVREINEFKQKFEVTE